MKQIKWLFYYIEWGNLMNVDNYKLRIGECKSLTQRRLAILVSSGHFLYLQGGQQHSIQLCLTINNADQKFVFSRNFCNQMNLREGAMCTYGICNQIETEPSYGGHVLFCLSLKR